MTAHTKRELPLGSEAIVFGHESISIQSRTSYEQPLHLIGVSAVLQKRLQDAIAGRRVWPQGIDEPLQRHQDLHRMA